MADKVVEQPEVPVEETEKDLKEKKVAAADAEEVKETVEAEEKTEEEPEKKEDAAKENGDAEKEENGKEATNGDSTPAADADEDKCCIKRKSTGGEKEEAATKGDEVIPEKKAKLDETASPQEAESNGEAEVAA